MKTKKRPKYKLLTTGGQGCIFEPAIPCYKKRTSKKTRGSRKRRKRHKQSISKVTFNRKSAEREITMDDIIRKIPKHEGWCILWDALCETPPYHRIVKKSELSKCLEKKNITHTKKQRYPQLVGYYGGKTMYDYSLSLFKKQTFSSQAKFDEAFNKLTKPFYNLCEGAVELGEAGITHGDLSVRNVIVKKGKGYMIDFGLSYLFKNTTYLKKRIKYLFSLEKSYDIYPYDYTLAGGTKGQIQAEIADIENGDFREGHEDHRRFHEIVLGRTNFNERLVGYLRGPKPNIQTIVRSLDTYSLGIMIPAILHDVTYERDVSFGVLQERCAHTNRENKRFLEICKYMTEFAPMRPSPTEVLVMLG